MKSSNKLLIIYWTISIPQNYYQNVRIRYGISLAIKKTVMQVTYEYMMTSSDQTLWIFSRLNDPIYSVKLILMMLTYILLLQLLCHSVHPTFCYGGWASNEIFKKGGLDRIQFLEWGCWERVGWIFSRGLQFLHKK